MRSWRLTAQCAGVLSGVLLIGTAAAGTAEAPAQAAQGRSGAVGPASSLSVPDRLTGVAVVSARMAWTVGYALTAGVSSKPIIAAWNGTRWKLVPVPGIKSAFLTSVAAASARDAWAVGTREVLGGPPIIVHWNGHGWKQVPSHSPGTTSQLFGMAAASANNAWAVGYSGNARPRPVIMHWNGTAWKNVPAPPGGSVLLGVAATSARNAWAVGDTPASKTLIIRWNGSAWK